MAGGSDLTEVLLCPVSRQPLRVSTEAELTAARRWLSLDAGAAPHGSKLAAGYTSADGTRLYPVQEGVILLLPQSAIPLDGPAEARAADLRDEKLRVQEFYDEFGWQEHENGTLGDTQCFVDDRPLSREYLRRCNLRVNEHLPAGGTYLLDAGSGAIALPEYLTYSDSFEKRICVDLSMAGLLQARQKLGDRGVYILGDITNLPLQENSVDAVVSLHNLYHVPADEQLQALRELHRVLRPGHKALVVYSWGHRALGRRLRNLPNSLLRLARLPVRVWRRLRRGSRATPVGQARRNRSLYYHTHARRYFVTALREFGIDLQILAFQSVHKDFTTRWVRPGLLGGPLVACLYACESRFPRLLGRIGQYPLFVIRK